MSKRFTSRWTKKEETPSVISKIKNVAKPSESFKDQITIVTQRLDLQTKNLDQAIIRFQNRGKEIFDRVVRALGNREEARANILAAELSEIRKIEKMLTHASLAIQSVSMRLSTVSEMGDLVAALSPATAVLGCIKTEMCTIFPEASQELGNIGNLHSEICTTTSQDMNMASTNTSINSEAMQILQEAEVAAERRLSAQLPDISSETSVRRRASLGN